MNEIICPHCNESFKLDDAGYADILKQVRDHQFEEELKTRLDLAEKDKANAVEIAEQKIKNTFQDELSKKERELGELKIQNQVVLAEQLAKKEKELNDTPANKERELAEMKAKVEKANLEQKISITEAVQKVEKERDKLASTLENKELEKQLLEKSLVEKFSIELQTKDNIIKMKDEEIALRKDMKLKLSTKMLGETLEQHCETEFNKLRATAFQRAYFEKDNDSKSGTKGDYIYREVDEDGNEIISIMFEMKNESDVSASKNKNEKFYEKLDSDRKKKNCEYAVLVTSLEKESALFNSGIVDVSHKYEKMLVIRPQFFIPIITTLRNAALKSLQTKRELEAVKAQNIDISNFESSLNSFKLDAEKIYGWARDRYDEAIDSIDKAIEDLEAAKENLEKSRKHLGSANKKAQELTIRTFTKNNPTMEEKFKELGS
jgi:hypothetical protein